MKKKISFHGYITVFHAVTAILFFSVSTAAKAVEIPLIIPVPQEIRVTGEDFIVDETISIIVPENASEQDISLARALVRELSDSYGVALLIRTGNTIPENGKSIVMGTISNPLVNKYCSDNNLKLTEKRPGDEGYILHVKNNLVVVAGWDNPGAFFGFQSLRQLLQSDKGKRIRGVEVTDWVNPRFGKVIKEVNLHGSENYQATQQDYGKVVTAPMNSNAIILAGISKVPKRVPYIPR